MDIYVSYEYDLEWFNPETNSYFIYKSNDIVRLPKCSEVLLRTLFGRYMQNITPKDCKLIHYKILDYWYG